MEEPSYVAKAVGLIATVMLPLLAGTEYEALPEGVELPPL